MDIITMFKRHLATYLNKEKVKDTNLLQASVVNVVGQMVGRDVVALRTQFSATQLQDTSLGKHVSWTTIIPDLAKCFPPLACRCLTYSY